MIEVQVRTANAEQAPDIASLVSEVYGAFTGDFVPTALKWTPDQVAAEHGHWLVATRDAQLVGAVHHHPDPEGYTLDALSVRTQRRREGIGSRLVSEVERRARCSGATQMIIALRRTLPANTVFFTSHGYRVTRPYGDEHDVYVKPLEASR